MGSSLGELILYFWLWLEYEELRNILVEGQNKGGCEKAKESIGEGRTLNRQALSGEKLG